MEHDEITARQMVDRYLTGRLSPPETAAFEEHFLECPDCLEELELGRRFRSALGRVTAAQSADIANVAPESRRRTAGLFAGLAALPRGARATLAGGLLAAAMLALLIPAGLLRRQALGFERRLAAAGANDAGQGAQPQINGALFQLSPQRSLPSEPSDAAAIRVLTLPAGARWVVLALDIGPASPPPTAPATPAAQATPAAPATPAAGVYSATLTRGGTVVWQAASLIPDLQGSLVVQLPAPILAPGTYELVVAQANAAVAHFSFRTARR